MRSWADVNVTHSPVITTAPTPTRPRPAPASAPNSEAPVPL